MKYINSIKLFFLFSLLGLLNACDFEEKNINPNQSCAIDPAALLTYIQLNYSEGGLSKTIQVGTCMMLVQQTASSQQGEMPGDKYNHSDVYGDLSNKYYNTIIKNYKELVKQAEGDEKYTATLGVAKIFGSFLFQRLTDFYGEIPYSQAGGGYNEQIYYPIYDSQEDIYKGLIKDIEDGLVLLNKEGYKISGDIIYNGDISKWKKFGNSMLLRLGMRMQKVNPELAKATINKGIANGTMTTAEDATMLKHIAGQDRTENHLSNRFEVDDYVESGMIKVSKTFIDHLKLNNDPRMAVYCSLSDGDADPTKQKGFPNGNDMTTIEVIDPAYDHNTYSNFNTNTILKLDAPAIFMSAAESELIKAEAILRGWMTGNANEHYEKAVRISMKEQASYGDAGIISDTDIQDYLDQKLLENAISNEAKLEVIGEEFWVATFINGYESYANWRRMGYPQLTPTNYKTGNTNAGTIPRRLTYPVSEYTNNRANIEAAIARQGADDLNTRVWWDAE